MQSPNHILGKYEEKKRRNIKISTSVKVTKSPATETSHLDLISAIHLIRFTQGEYGRGRQLYPGTVRAATKLQPSTWVPSAQEEGGDCPVLYTLADLPSVCTTCLVTRPGSSMAAALTVSLKSLKSPCRGINSVTDEETEAQTG